MTVSLASQPRLLGRVLGAVPDLLTGIACVIVWISPFTFGQDAVKTVVLMTLMEFLIVHGTGFFTGIAFSDSIPPRKRLLGMAGMLCFYGVFVAAWAYTFKAWWPVWVFAWLVIGKAMWIFINPRDRAAEKDRQIKAWAFSTAAYLVAVFMGLMLPLPELGITSALQPQLGLSGSGEWVEHPHVAVASMAIYYFANARFKWWSSGRVEVT
ncbi:MAG: hypothetical protein ABIO61_08275 [Thermomonas sp.]